MIILIRRLLLILVHVLYFSVIYDKKLYPLLLIMLLINISLYLQIITNPFQEKFMQINHLEEFSLISLLFSIFIGLIYLSHTFSSHQFNKTEIIYLLVSVIFINFAFFISFIKIVYNYKISRILNSVKSIVSRSNDKKNIKIEINSKNEKFKKKKKKKEIKEEFFNKKKKNKSDKKIKEEFFDRNKEIQENLYNKNNKLLEDDLIKEKFKLKINEFSKSDLKKIIKMKNEEINLLKKEIKMIKDEKSIKKSEKNYLQKKKIEEVDVEEFKDKIINPIELFDFSENDLFVDFSRKIKKKKLFNLFDSEILEAKYNWKTMKSDDLNTFFIIIDFHYLPKVLIENYQLIIDEIKCLGNI